MLELADVRVVADGLDHPEGVAEGPDGMLYAGGEAGQVYRIDPADGTWSQLADTGGFVLGLCLDAAGAIYACDAVRCAIVRVVPTTGEVETYCESASGRPLRSPNFAVFAADGTLWFSDSGTEDAEVVDGAVVSVPPGGGDGTVLDVRPLHFSNGLALAPDNALFVVESFAPGVSVIEAGQVRQYVSLPKTVPDGLALDEEGGLLISCYQPNLIARVPPGGNAAEVVVEDWSGEKLFTPTNVAFFGPERTQLAIAGLGGSALRGLEVPWRGQKLNHPSI